MPVRFAFALLALAASPVASAQLTLDWIPSTDANAGLPASIRAFESVTSGIPAWYVRADPADAGWDLRAVLSDQGTETVASFAADAGALVAINGGYFGGRQSFSLVLDGGQAFASNIAALNRDGLVYYPTRGAFGWNALRQPDVAWIYDVDGTQTAYRVPNANGSGQTPEPQPTASFPAGAMPWNVQTAIGGGPVLVENGEVRLTWEEEVFFGGSGVDTTSTRARTAVGYDADGHLLLLAVAENRGVTLRELAEVMIGIGAVEAVNLDGGGSTSLLAGGEPLYSRTRRVASALMIVRAGGPDGIIIDTGSPGYREEGAWFESANTPYYGATPARLLEVGAEGRAVFTWDQLPPSDTYRIEAWWVPGGNRATDTPFTVYEDGVPSTFRVDQSDPATAGRWNEIGMLPVLPGDSLVVTADATTGAGTTFVVVDAIRLTGLGLGNAAEPDPEDALHLRLAPNPARDRLAVSLTLRQPGEVRARLADALGRTVQSTSRAMGAGEGQVEIDVSGLAPGVYHLRVQAPTASASQRVTVVR